MSVPDEVRKVLNARATDGFVDVLAAIESGDREGLLRAVDVWAEALRDCRAAELEWEPST